MALLKRQPMSFPILAFKTILSLMLLNKAYSYDSLTFIYDGFHPDERNLFLQGDAIITSQNNAIQLTKTDGYGKPVIKTVGRVLHSQQLRLYEKGTSRVASFETRFRFSLYSPDLQKADGIAFFIAPPEATIPAGWAGATLGLFDLETALNASANQVVAVEFDTFYQKSSNTWDPGYNHIGINVNSIDSLNVTTWERQQHESVEFVVTYDPITRILKVAATYPNGKVYELSHEVDVKALLPEWVRFGFSAASGGAVQSHALHYWYFNSNLVDTNRKKKKDNNKYLARDV